MKLRIENCELRKEYVYLLCVLSSFLFTTLVFAQENFTITNYFSPKYRDFQMMKISIIPPAGFVKDTDGVGFIEPQHASALRAEVIKQNIKISTQSFFNDFDSAEHKDSLGMKLIESMNFTINGFEAHLVNMTAKVEGEDYIEWRLLIGDTSSTYVVRGFMPADGRTSLEHEIRTSLLTVFYEPDRRLLAPGADPTTTSSSACNCHRK